MNQADIRALVARMLDSFDDTGVGRDSGRFDPWDDHAGLRKLGSGAYGTAFLLPDGRVLKLSMAMDGTALWISEAAQHFALTGHPAEFAPKVWAFDTMKFMRKKAELLGFDEDGNTVPRKLWRYDTTLRNCYTAPVECEVWYAVMEFVTPADDEETEDEYLADLADQMLNHAVAWMAARSAHESEWGGISEDLHAGNWGYTEDGRMVMFDPFCDGDTTSSLLPCWSGRPVQAQPAAACTPN